MAQMNDCFADVITISLEEYKELLMIKGRYEKLKSNKVGSFHAPIIREGDIFLPKELVTPYTMKFTQDNESCSNCKSCK